MRGLLVKDFRLLTGQKNYVITVLFIAAVLAASGQNIFFIISYCTMVAVFYTIGTIGYDEADNGFPFLFTMPVSQRGYALEKYLLVFLTGGGVWLATTVAGAVYTCRMDSAWNSGEWFAAAFGIFLALELLVALMLPIQLKYGAQKSQIVIFVFLFAFFAGVFLVQKFQERLAPDMSFAWLANIGTADWLAVGAIVLVAGTLLSVMASIRIMGKKQF